jgi:hypothetical protein
MGGYLKGWFNGIEDNASNVQTQVAELQLDAVEQEEMAA